MDCYVWRSVTCITLECTDLTSALRVADSLVLPLNTTQYAIELQYYLEKWVSFPPFLASRIKADIARVQHIADSTGLNEGLNLTSLGASIQHLIGASQALDVKTTSQLEHLHKLLPPPPPHPHPHPHPHGCHSPRVQLKQAFLKVCAAFGSDRCEKKLHKYQHHHDHDHDHDRRPRKPELPKKRLEAIKKVLAELRAGNKKRQAFEGGFISEQGIKVGSVIFSLGSFCYIRELTEGAGQRMVQA